MANQNASTAIVRRGTLGVFKRGFFKPPFVSGVIFWGFPQTSTWAWGSSRFQFDNSAKSRNPDGFRAFLKPQIFRGFENGQIYKIR